MIKDGDFLFRLAQLDEQQEVIDFLNTHWGGRHPLVNDDRLREHYYLRDGAFNFALAYYKEKLSSVAGFIYTSKSHEAAYLSIWCADPKVKGIGLELADKLKTLTGVKTLSCNNIRPNTMPFYDFLGYKTGKFTRGYILADKAEYKLAKVAKKIVFSHTVNNVEFETIYNLDEKLLSKLQKGAKPQKDVSYINSRYFEYPFWKYHAKKIILDGECTGVFFYRIAEYDGAKAMRIVDFIGDPQGLSLLGQGVMQMLKDFDGEYADIYVAGMSEEVLVKGGFTVIDNGHENIIPNYTTPPIFENTEFYYFTSDEKDFVMYKADGDGDRPKFD